MIDLDDEPATGGRGVKGCQRSTLDTDPGGTTLLAPVHGGVSRVQGCFPNYRVCVRAHVRARTPNRCAIHPVTSDTPSDSAVRGRLGVSLGGEGVKGGPLTPSDAPCRRGWSA